MSVNVRAQAPSLRMACNVRPSLLMVVEDCLRDNGALLDHVAVREDQALRRVHDETGGLSDVAAR